MLKKLHSWLSARPSIATKGSIEATKRTRLNVESLEDRVNPTTLPNLGNVLSDVVDVYNSTSGDPGFSPTAFAANYNTMFYVAGDRILVEGRTNGDFQTWLASMQQIGFTPVATASDVGLAEGFLSFDKMDEAANLPLTRSVLPVYRFDSFDSQGSVANAAEISLNAALARRVFGVDGSGVTVGVISDSANAVGGGIADSQATGDLPPGNRVIDLTPSAMGTDEGRAMMELIFDIAPGANFIFASGNGGDANLRTAIETLANMNVDIIVDDINGITTEPFFQDGLAARGYDNAVTLGTLNFSSAGNRGSSAYESNFSGTNTTVAGIAGRWHDFDTSATVAASQLVTLGPGMNTFVFQYDDPFYGGNGVNRNADFFILNAAGNTVLASGTDNNLITGVPREIVSIDGGAGGTQVRVAIRIFGGGADIGRFRYMAGTQNGLFTVNEFTTNPGVLTNGINSTHMGSLSTIAVAAAPNATPLTPEATSGVGPVTRLFTTAGARLAAPETRNKPDITAISAVNTSVPGFAPFGGSSAAAPNAAAVAALIQDFNPSLTNAQIQNILFNSTVDIGAPGVDNVSGRGLIDALGALVTLNGGVLPINGDFDMPNQNDNIVLRRNATEANSIDVIINGQNLGTVRKQFITNGIILNTGGGNDTVTFDFSNGNFTTGVSITVNTGDGNDIVNYNFSGSTFGPLNITLNTEAGNDTINYNFAGGTFNNPFTIAANAGDGDDIFNLDFNGVLALPPVTLALNGGAGNDTAVIRNNSDFTVSGTQIRLGTFSPLNTASFIVENFDLRAGAGANTFTFNSDSVGNFLVNGFESSDRYIVNLDGSTNYTVQINDTGTTGNDLLFINGTPGDDNLFLQANQVSATNQNVFYNNTIEIVNVATVGGNDTLTIIPFSFPRINFDAGEGDDTYIVNLTGSGSLTFPIVDTGLSTGDVVRVIGTPFGDIFNVNATQTSVLGETITYTTGIDNVVVNGGSGADTFNLTFSTTTRISIDGGDPTTIPGDTLLFDRNQGSVDKDTPTSGLIFADGFRPTRFDNIESLTSGTVTVDRFAVGNGPGLPSQAKMYDSAGNLLFTVDPYGRFTGGIRVATGDVNGDGVQDLVTAASAGGGPHVKVFDGRSGAEIGSFFAYAPNFTNGISLAVGDVNGDGITDIITGAGPGGGPHVRVFNGFDSTELNSFFAFTTVFSGGVDVAASDINGDGRKDVVVAAGPGGGPHVIVVDGRGLSSPENRELLSVENLLLASFYAYSVNFTGGVSIAGGDVNGDFFDDLIFGVFSNGPAHLRIISGRDQSELASFFAEDPSFTGGIRVASLDRNGDSVVDAIVLGRGRGALPIARAIDPFTASQFFDVQAFGQEFLNGVFVG